MLVRATVFALVSSIAFLVPGPAGFAGERGGPPPPIKEFFAGCGQLGLGPQSCTLLHTDAGSWAVDDTGGFFIGDTVFVSGTIDPSAFDCFPVQIPALHVISIGECFDECGVLVAAPFCGIGLLVDLKGLFLLDQVGQFKPGDHVRVTGGLIKPCFVVPECQAGACVSVGSIVPCGLAPVATCGELVLDPGGCIEFLADTGFSYVLRDLGGFLPGDRVFVSGSITTGVPACSPKSIFPLVDNDIITQCFEACGTIGIGPQGCPTFQADDGEGYFIDSTGGFGPGDHVSVTGGVIDDFQCFPVATSPGILTGSIESCAGRSYSSFGTIEFSVFGCLVFVPTGGGSFIIESQPGFQPGDFVHVTGVINPECISFCFLPCLEQVTMQHAFTGCGTLNQGFECLFFTADSDPGLLFSIFGATGFSENDHVQLTGIIDEQCFSFCFVPCLFVDTIDLTGADLNCDGLVNTLDLGTLLSSWSIPSSAPGCRGALPCPSDLNGDLFVNTLDLGIMLSSWSL